MNKALDHYECEGQLSMFDKAYPLEYEQTTKNDLGVDCIDRQATLDAIIKRLGINNESYLLPAERTIYQQIKDMPSVTPQEPRKGHWIPTYGNVKCSECGSVKDSREVGRATHYCDFCGCKMVEPQESEDNNDIH